VTGAFDQVVGLEELAEPVGRVVARILREDQIVGTCRTCDDRGPPPRDEEAEERVLSALFLAKKDQAFPNLDAVMFAGWYQQQVAFVLLEARRHTGRWLSAEETSAALLETWPQHWRAWEATIKRAIESAPAKVPVAEDIELLRRFADQRELLRKLAQIDADIRAKRIGRVETLNAGREAFAPFRSKAIK
jgi:hypothetical protein